MPSRPEPEHDAGLIMPKLREESPRLLKICKGSRRLSKQLKLRRADAQDLVLLQLVEEVQELRRRVLQRRKAA